METLTARLVRGGPLTEADAVGWAVRIARAVEPVHERLGEHGRISADALEIEAESCTSEGRLVDFADLPANPAYHSPERTRGGGASQADDTWALAVTLYFALSGTLPFSGSTPEEVRRKVTSVPAPPLAVFDVGDDALQQIVERALASSAAERTTSLSELRGQLEGWLGTTMFTRAEDLPPLLGGDDNEDEVTMIQVGPPSALLRKQLDAALAAAAAASAPSTPAPVPAPAPAPDSRGDSGTGTGTGTGASAAPPSQSAPPPASAAPASAARTVPASRTANLVAAALGILLGLAGIAFFWWHKDPGDVQGTAPPPPALPPSPASVSKPAPAPSAAPSVAPASVSASASAPHASVSASASPLPASTSKPAAPPGDLASCVTSMFPPESFPPSADFTFVCAQPDPLKGAADVRARLVSARKHESEGMQEWAFLGWYELAAFSVMRGRCCASPPPLKMAEVPKSCEPVPEVFASIDRAVAKATSASDDDLQKAVDAYTHDVYCIVRTGIAARFGRVDRPQGGEDTAFKRFLERVIKAKR